MDVSRNDMFYILNLLTIIQHIASLVAKIAEFYYISRGKNVPVSIVKGVPVLLLTKDSFE